MKTRNGAGRVLSALAFVATASSLAGADGPTADATPRIHAFAPAAVHAGDDCIIDAQFAGARPPRVWIGKRRVPGRGVRVERATAGSAVRRVRVRIPGRVPAGDHVLKIATRAGAAVAAKPIKVASCIAAPTQPVDCADIPNSGAELMVTGAGGYSRVLRQPSSLDPDVLFGQTGLQLFIRPDFAFNMTIFLEPANIHVGDAPVLVATYTAASGQYWERLGGTVRVVEESATRVGLCVDMTLRSTFPEIQPPGDPLDVTVKGYLVVTR